MKEMHQWADVSPMAMHLPERRDIDEKMMAAHLDALGKVKATVGHLCAALSDDQKRTADELMTGMMMM